MLFRAYTSGLEFGTRLCFHSLPELLVLEPITGKSVKVPLNAHFSPAPRLCQEHWGSENNAELQPNALSGWKA